MIAGCNETGYLLFRTFPLNIYTSPKAYIPLQVSELNSNKLIIATIYHLLYARHIEHYIYCFFKNTSNNTICVVLFLSTFYFMRKLSYIDEAISPNSHSTCSAFLPSTKLSTSLKHSQVFWISSCFTDWILCRLLSA